MAERKLAHVETIAEIRPHPNGDKIELAKVLGCPPLPGNSPCRSPDL